MTRANRTGGDLVDVERFEPLIHPALSGDTAGPRTLIIGDLQRWKSARRALPRLTGLHFVDVDDLTSLLFEELEPEVVMSPLVVRDFDVVDIGALLAELGFRGRYRAVVEDIADCAMIAAEVADVAPALDFAVIVFPAP